MLSSVNRTGNVRAGRLARVYGTPSNSQRAGWTADEALAIAQLRRWASDRAAQRSGKGPGPANPEQRGGDRRSSRFDACLVRTIDFGRVMDGLDPKQSVALRMTYVDGESCAVIAAALGVSERTVFTLIADGRAALALALEERNLL